MCVFVCVCVCVCVCLIREEREIGQISAMVNLSPVLIESLNCLAQDNDFFFRYSLIHYATTYAQINHHNHIEISSYNESITQLYYCLLGDCFDHKETNTILIKDT